MKLIAVIPAYNEQGRIAASVKDAAAFVDDVVVVDDCSRDQTGEEAELAGAHVLRHLINRGQGAALQTGMDYALHTLQADLIVHFDADGQMQGQEIPMMVEPIMRGDVEVTLGSRFLGKAENIPLSRRLLLKAGIVFTALTSGLWLSDTHNGFRALSRKAASVLRLQQDRMAHASEILELLAKSGLMYREVPVTIRYSTETLAKGQSPRGAITIALHLLKGKLIK